VREGLARAAGGLGLAREIPGVRRAGVAPSIAEETPMPCTDVDTRGFDEARPMHRFGCGRVKVAEQFGG